MHPVMIVIPAAVLIFGPRAWVSHLLKKHDKHELDLPVTAGKFAREVLDRHGLQRVRVESTDIGDHYDQQAKAVRLARSRFDRKSLTALTTTAHEVSHALQDASAYPPFVWRTHLAKVAQMAGQLGVVMLVTVPMLSMTTHRPFPFHTVGTAVFGIMGTGLVAQLAALPSELDASFNRAIPLLRENCIGEDKIKDARIILVACSMTYVAASMISLLNFWPWFISGALASPARNQEGRRQQTVSAEPLSPRPERPRRSAGNRSAMEPIVRQLGKPLIRCWLQVRQAF
jgi:Zn-dependent membrane protease YugP